MVISVLKRIKRILAKSALLREVYHGVRSSLNMTYEKKYHPISYGQWIEKSEPQVWTTTDFKKKPLISVVVPAYNTPDKYLHPLIESFENQRYENWQLCIADGSDDEARAKAIADMCAADDRIAYTRVTGKEQGIVTNTNEAIKLTKGEFVGFCDHDDLLSPHALYEVVAAINDNSEADMFYSDEDKVSDDGKTRSHPFFKPGWSPQLLEGVNYLTHFLVVRRSIIAKVGSFRTGYDG